MMLSDRTILERYRLFEIDKDDPWGLNITPFVSTSIKTVNNKPVISYGVSSYGYDIRLGYNFLIENSFSGTIDPKADNSKLFASVNRDELIIPPHGFVLAHSLEYIKVPRDVNVICLGKSTYARCGLVVNTTPLEPEWEGHITLELSNTTNSSIKVYAGEGIAQLLFITGSTVCDTSYKDRSGKYNNQAERPVLPKV